MALVRILVDYKRLCASREAGQNLGCISIFPFDRQAAPRMVKGLEGWCRCCGNKIFEFKPEFGTGNVHGYADHICLIAEESDLNIIE